MAILENGDKKYSALISEIESGQVKIPQFQRQFVWDMPASAKLIDSILKGYPIGTFIYWRTNERLRSIRNIGYISLPEPQDGEFINYVLDGQQRITSLFAALKGEKILRESGKEEDFSQIYIALEAGPDDTICITDISDYAEDKVITLKTLMFGRGKDIYNRYHDELHGKIDEYKETLQSYQFKGINLKDADIDVATEVFTRLNVGGKPLSLFEIMVAKTYHVFRPNPQDPQASGWTFDLAEKYEELTNELSSSHFETVPSATILQVVAILLEKECTRKSILRLDKMRFIKIWGEATDCIKRSIDFFRGYGIAVGRILPYNALLVPFSYFFYKYKQPPTGEIKKKLEDFFWRCSIGFRYSSGVEAKLVQDIGKIDQILKNKLPKYEWAVTVDKEFVLKQGFFSTGKSFVKAILCLYAKQKPKSFDSNLDVIIDNSWLKIASSKNYHHFFPKSWLTKNYNNIDYSIVNHIVNITIVDDSLNKNTIKAKSPAVYMKAFLRKNEDLASTMKTHFIDINRDGIWENDYEKFFDNRLSRISRALNKHLIPQEAPSAGLEVYEDIEESEENGI
jgi:hypothetical protein